MNFMCFQMVMSKKKGDWPEGKVAGRFKRMGQVGSFRRVIIRERIEINV